MDDEIRLTLAATFNGVADGYEARPEYPDEIYSLLANRGCGAGARVLEVGPATGLATMRLLDLGAAVTAVEPGPALAARLRERTAGRACEVVVSSFESAALPDAAFDLLVAATAFHWVEPGTGFAKAASLVRPGGWLALWWTVFGDASRPDPFERALRPMLRDLAPELQFDAFASSVPYALDVDARIGEIDATGAFEPVEHHVVPWEGHHDAAGIRALFATYSPWLALPEATRTRVLDELERIARDDFGDAIVRPYQTVIYLARRSRESGRVASRPSRGGG
ncbi:MAG TPA: methyltransferase domain-containing protein [Acidimicrobiia bacterium]|nr:methyltransferase domain-containing protein [Acidimicrobiia bacterium]